MTVDYLGSVVWMTAKKTRVDNDEIAHVGEEY
jgi:hypothetical protein